MEADEGQSYLVKSPIEADAAASLAIERDVLVALVGTRRFLRTPQVLDWDAATLDPRRRPHPRRRPAGLPQSLARSPGAHLVGRQIAGALAELHAIDWAPAAGARGNLSRAPWILELDAPDISVEATLSAAGIELIRIAQASGLAGELAQLRLCGIRRPWSTTTSDGTTGPCDADDVRSCSSTWKWLAWATPHGTSDRRSRAA